MAVTPFTLPNAVLLAVALLSPPALPVRPQAAPGAVDRNGDALPAGATARLATPRREAGNPAEVTPLPTVREIAFSPDGRTVATRGEPENPAQVRQVLLWNVADGRVIRTFEADTSPLASLTFSADGSWLIAGGTNEEGVWVWDVGSSRLLHRLPGGRGPIAVVRETGRLAVVGAFGRNDVVRLYDLASGTETQRHVVDVSYKFEFAPDGRAFLSTSRIGDSLLRLTDSETRAVTKRFRGLPRQPLAFAMSPDRRTVAASSGDAEVVVWEVASGEEVFRLAGHERAVRALAFSADSRQLATGCSNGQVRIWDLATGRPLHTFTGHEKAIASLAFAPDGMRLVSGSFDRTALIWNLTAIPRSTLPDTVPDETQRAALWRDLATTAPAPAYRAIGFVRHHNEELVPWLRREVDAQLAPIEQPRIERLIRDLDHDDFRVRFRATEELRKLRDAVHPVLLRVVKQTASAEVRHRVRRLLTLGEDTPRFTGADIRRMLRIVHALESLTGPEAMAVLERLARDFPSAEVQSAARQAIEADRFP